MKSKTDFKQHLPSLFDGLPGYYYNCTGKENNKKTLRDHSEESNSEKNVSIEKYPSEDNLNESNFDIHTTVENGLDEDDYEDSELDNDSDVYEDAEFEDGDEDTLIHDSQSFYDDEEDNFTRGSSSYCDEEVEVYDYDAHKPPKYYYVPEEDDCTDPRYDNDFQRTLEEWSWDLVVQPDEDGWDY